MPINVTFGTIAYRDGGVIAVPATFAAAVIAPSKHIFNITHVSGSVLGDVDYRLVGKNTAYALIVQLPPDRSGSFRITADGEALKKSGGTWDNITATAKTVPYNTAIPQLQRYEIPADYTPGERFDVIYEFTTSCTLGDPVAAFGTGATYADFFIFEGADFGTPNFYRKTNNTFPAVPIPDFPVNGNTDWSNADLQTTAATIYLVRWKPVESSARGVFNMTMKEGFVRGPVS